MQYKLTLFILFFFLWACKEKSPRDNPQEIPEEEQGNYWWPRQPLPEGIVTCKTPSTHGETALAYSLSGLVAQAQKNGQTDELIWQETGGDYEEWHQKFVDRSHVEVRGRFSVWELLNRHQSVVKGYILYEPEADPTFGEQMDFSYNIAVSYAGIKQAVVISPDLEPEMKALGYQRVLDAREISKATCFDELKGSAGTDMVVTMNPAFHNNRDLAVANKAFVTYGTNQIPRAIMSLTDPVSPVVGWNHGHEDDFTLLPTRHGLFNTASDWCHNLLVLSAGSKEASFSKIKTLDPRTIDFENGKHFHSFILSDGDNMQWTMGAFIHNPDYWGSPLHGDFPVGFTSCPVNLSMMAPDVLDEIAQTQPKNTTVIEYGGGYQYPDHFAKAEGNEREKILRAFARKINLNMKRTGTKVFGFICMDVDSPDAQEAYQIFAEELENLTGMFAVQYAPYHGGHGEIFWGTNKEGIHIPVVTAKYSLWKGLNYEGGGNPAKIAGYINEAAERKEGTMDWTVVHAWSGFENPESTGMEESGLGPVKWCIDELDDAVNIISPEALLWRIRMKHYKEETMRELEEWNNS